jgi:hypothetical protein
MSQCIPLYNYYVLIKRIKQTLKWDWESQKENCCLAWGTSTFLLWPWFSLLCVCLWNEFRWVFAYCVQRGLKNNFGFTKTYQIIEPYFHIVSFTFKQKTILLDIKDFGVFGRPVQCISIFWNEENILNLCFPQVVLEHCVMANAT